ALGPLGRRTSLAGAACAQRRAIGMFSLHGDPGINRVGPWVHRLHVGPEEQARALVRGARRVMRLSRAAVLFPETAYGEAGAAAFARAWLADAGVLAGVSSYPERTTDYRRPLGALTGLYAWVGDDTDRRKSPGKAGYVRVGRAPLVDFDTLFVPDYHARIARILGFLPGSGIQNGEGGDGVAVQMLGLSGWHGDTMGLTGSMAAGAVIVDVFAGEAGGGRAESFFREFGSRTGRDPSDVEAEAFDGAVMLGMMMRDVARRQASWRTRGRRALVANLHAMKPWRGACGAVHFATDGSPVRELSMFRFDMDGALAPLD
ncbi:MAG: ABC transporter substrate-binding protein, partial [Myxococcota bacterium]